MSAIAPVSVSPEPADGRSFLLERVQPALSGLMDGSLSTLAPSSRSCWPPTAR